mmetsp:Transcript_129228/g.361646  ORF Transcript_129228/g.361646 Transcript_129228/m.361646 type:complete len:257 (-) Transcript_129228:239-1009(-)
MEDLACPDGHRPNVQRRDQGRLGVCAVGADAVEIRQRHALELLHDEDALAGDLRVRLRSRGAPRQPLRGQEGSEYFHVFQLQAEVELSEHGGANLGDDVHEGRPCEHRGEEAEHLRGDEEETEVGLQHALDTGFEHLHSDALAVARKDSIVHLSDGGGGHRPAVEAGEHLAKGPPQILLDDLLDLLEGRGLGLVQTFLELPDIRLWEEGRRGRDELPQLDVRRAEVLEEPSQHLGERFVLHGAPEDAAGQGGQRVP